MRWFSTQSRKPPVFGEAITVSSGFYAGQHGVVMDRRTREDYLPATLIRTARLEYQLRLAEPMGTIREVWVNVADL